MAQTGCSNGDNSWSLKGMTALVTGGTRGIGSVLPVFLFWNELNLICLCQLSPCFYINSVGMLLWKN